MCVSAGVLVLVVLFLPPVSLIEQSVAISQAGELTPAVIEPEPPVTEGPVIAEASPIVEETPIPGTAGMTDDGATPEGSADEGDATGACLQAHFEGETIPDRTQMEPGEEFTKTWSFKNTGICDWPEDTVLAKVESQLSGPESVPVGAVAAEETIDISVNLVAPDPSGTYSSRWALRTGDTGIPGGGNIWALIRVGENRSFELGGHVQNHKFPYAGLMHYAGMNWAKAQIRWRSDPLNIITSAHAAGFKIQLSALGSADLITKPGFGQDFVEWVAELAAAGADAIEVWNEPNIDREWQNGYISPQAYTNLLCTAYHAIKAVNPGTLVIGAAPAPTGYFGGCGPGGCDDQPWMEGLYNAGAANCMDYIGAHHNAGATSPSARSGHVAGTHHSYYFLPQTELYYNIFRGTRKLFYTEMGYVSPEGYGWIPDSFSWGGNTTVAQQAAWLAEAAQLSASTGMVRCIIVWNVDYQCYDDCSDVPDPQAGYAIIRPGGTCPACDALHNVLGTR